MINLKSQKEIAAMREGGRILAGILDTLKNLVKPGIATSSLEEKARKLIDSHSVHPSFLGYGGFPAVLCVSINHQIVHGVPSDDVVIKEGDVVSLDIGIKHKGFHTDTAWTGIASSDPAKWKDRQKLTRVTIEALEKGIAVALSGNTTGHIGQAIQNHVEKNGFSVVRDLVGHGVGKKLHEEPEVPNYGKPGQGIVLKPGMTIAIEPMVLMGDWKVKEGADGFSYETKDGSLAAHVEHTIAITEKEAYILTEK